MDVTHQQGRRGETYQTPRAIGIFIEEVLTGFSHRFGFSSQLTDLAANRDDADKPLSEDASRTVLDMAIRALRLANRPTTSSLSILVWLVSAFSYFLIFSSIWMMNLLFNGFHEKCTLDTGSKRRPMHKRCKGKLGPSLVGV